MSATVAPCADPHAPWQGWFDGAAEPSNPGQRAIGVVLVAPDGAKVTHCERIGYGTNNEAEYAALVDLLQRALQAGARRLVVRGDSQLVIEQVSGRWQVRSPGLLDLCAKVRRLAMRFERVQFIWVRRHLNTEADALSKAAYKLPKVPHAVATPEAFWETV